MGVVCDLLFDALLVQFIGRVGSDPRAYGGWRNQLIVVGKRAHVQDLHANLGVRRRRMNGIGDLAVPGGFLLVVELGGGKSGVAVLILDHDAAFFVGGDAPGNDHADTTGGTLGVKSGHPVKAVGHFLKPGVHGAHDAAVAKGGETQVQGREQQRIMGVLVEV